MRRKCRRNRSSVGFLPPINDARECRGTCEGVRTRLRCFWYEHPAQAGNRPTWSCHAAGCALKPRFPLPWSLLRKDLDSRCRRNDRYSAAALIIVIPAKAGIQAISCFGVTRSVMTDCVATSRYRHSEEQQATRNIAVPLFSERDSSLRSLENHPLYRCGRGR